MSNLSHRTAIDATQNNSDLRYYDVQKFVWELKLKPAGRKLVLICLAFHSDNFGACFPHIDTISAETNMGKSTIKEHLKTLENDGHIRRERLRYPNGYLAGYRYFINVRSSDLGENPKSRVQTSYVQSSDDNKDQLKTNTVEARDIANEILEHWNAMAFKHGLAVVKTNVLNATRKRHILNRLADCKGDASLLSEAISNVPKNPHWLGYNNSGWRADFDWVFSASRFPQILEYTPAKKINDKPNIKRNYSSKLKGIGNTRRNLRNEVLAEFAPDRLAKKV